MAKNPVGVNILSNVRGLLTLNPKFNLPPADTDFSAVKFLVYPELGISKIDKKISLATAGITNTVTKFF